MSSKILITSRDQILQGDLIRIENPELSSMHIKAVEYRAKVSGFIPAAWSGTFSAEFDSEGRVVYCLDRPVVLPTLLYSMVIPPVSQIARQYAYVLEPFGEEGPAWRYVSGSGRAVSADEVRKHVSNGWRIINGPEHIEENSEEHPF